MELNRNHYFMIGLLVLCLGIQFRLVESYVLNERVTRFVTSRMSNGSKASTFLPAVGPLPRKVIQPPQWLGWALMSVGSVLMLHSLAMTKPEGG